MQRTAIAAAFVFACAVAQGQDIQRQSRQFTLWPKVKDAGAITIKTLYVTPDAGETWRAAADAGVVVEWIDKDGRPGARVTVPGDGRWGFYFQVGDEVTNTNAAPIGGTRPQVSVVVNTTGAPSVEPSKPVETKPVETAKPAVAVRTGTAPTGTIVISPRGGETWTAGSAGLIKWMTPEGLGKPNSAALYYRTAPEASWELVTLGLENTGFYLWGVPSVSGDKVQVRLSVMGEDGKERFSPESKPFTVKTVLEPDFAGARRRYENARVYAARGETGPAAGELDEALRLWPDYPDALNDLGVAYFQLGEHGKALELFLRASRVQQGDPKALYNAATALLAMGLDRDALAKLQAAATIARDIDERLSSAMAEKVLVIASAHQRRGDVAGAHQACVWGLQLVKASPIIRGRLEELARAAAEHLPPAP